MENLPTPLSRVELYLAKACGMDVTVPEQPLSRLEQFLAILAGDTSITMPTPASLTEQWLAYVLGVTPDPLLSVEGACLIGAQKVDVRYFAVAASMPGATLPEAPQNRAEMYWAHIAGNPPTPGILKYVTGKYFYLTDVVSGIEELQYVKGDTYQQTYSGKNLFSSVIEVGGINASGQLTNFTTRARSKTKIAVQPNTGYTLSMVPKDSSKTINMTVQGWKSDGTFISQITGLQWVTVPVTFTTPANCTQITISGRYSDDTSFGTLGSETDVFQNIQLETGSQATSYEPYTGGIPAPSPSYPMLISVVTGAQTVTIGDGVSSEDFTISLSSIELCKIGTYQDYIYKSGDDWYVHKTTARVDVSSLGGWFASGSYAYKTRNGMSDILPASSDSSTAVGLCNAFSASTTNLVYAGSVDYGFALPGAGGTGILIRNKNVASLADFTTYLSNNPVYGYFALATPTDTKITDATLISQLNALNSAPLPKPIANITVSATGTNLTPYLTIAYYGSDEE